jgi:hypothetical protein
MNNTRTLAIVAVLTAATLVVGAFVTTATIATTRSALAYPQQKKDDNKKDGGNNNGNTITIQKCKQAATQSGWDNDQEQECENVICTHPGDSATCVSEGGGNKTAGGGGGAIDPCLNCFTTNLDATEQAAFIKAAQSLGVSSLEDICRLLETGQITVKGIGQILSTLVASGDVSEAHATAVTQCLLDLGFPLK